MNKKEIEEELKDISPFLANIKKDKKEGFSMPANYFDRFEDRLMHRIETESALEPKAIQENDNKSVWSFFRGLLTAKMQYAMGISMVVLVMLIALPLINQEPTLPSATSSGLLAQLSQEEAKNYVAEHVDDFSTEDLTATVEQERLNELQATVTVVVEEEIIETEPIEVGTSEQLDEALEKIDEAVLDDLSEEMLEEDLDDLF